MENNNTTFTARLHSDKSKNPVMHNFQQLTIEEAKKLTGHCYFVTRMGSVANAKVTSVKTWKTRSGHCDVNLKYGMYEFFCAQYRDGSTIEQLVKMVD